MSYKFDIYTFVFGIFLIFSVVYPQSQNFHFTHITTDDGLSQSNVTCILQDHKGFMWIGTFNGLNRYNGYEFEVYNYRPEDSHSLTDNFISTLFEDKDGNLWVGTSDGLNCFDRKMNRFTSYKHQGDDPSSIADNQIETIVEDRNGHIWIGTRNGGVAIFQPSTDSFIYPFSNKHPEQRLSSNSIRKIFEDSEGNLWIGHWNGAIDVLSENPDAANFRLVYSKKLTDSPITEIVESKDKSIWIATQGNGLYRLKHNSTGFNQIAYYSTVSPAGKRISSNIILSLMTDHEDRLWIGTEDKGIDILDLKTDFIQHIEHDPFNPSGLAHNSVWEIYQDRSGNIWIGTYAHGIDLLAGSKSYFQHFKHIPGKENSLNHNMVNAFWEDKDQNLWIATDGGGINVFDRKMGRFDYFNTENSNIGSDIIVSLMGDKQGRLWVGTWADGLYMFDLQSKKFTHYSKEKDGLATNRILHILEGRDGGLWLATYWGGLTYFNVDKDSAKIYNRENSGLSDDYVRVTFQDTNGNLWIGTDLGLDYLNPLTNKIKTYRHQPSIKNSLSKGFVHSIIKSTDGSIWIGTAGGLNKYDPTTDGFIHYSTENGLANNEIKCIVEDDNGNLWLSTNWGISFLDTKTEKFKNFDITDGLQGNEFNIRSGLKTSKGEIIFGGNNGFNIIQTTNFKRNTYIPPVVITAFRIFNKPVSIAGKDSLLKAHINESKKLHLSYRYSVFSFDFAALNYVVPEKNRYAFMMEGFEHEWNYVGSTRSATYTNLDPGHYVFRVKASNNDGIWNEVGTAIQITIDPPFWKTWWAYLIVFLLMIAIIGFILNYFISRQRLKNALKLEHLELEKMYELDQMRTQLFTNISHELYSPITLTLSPLEKLISTQKKEADITKTLKLIYRNARRIQRIVNQLKDFQKIESGDLQLSLSRGNIFQYVGDIVDSFRDYAIDHHIRYQFIPEQENCQAWFDPDKLDKIIYNLLSNAFKFTPDRGEITVKASVTTAESVENFTKDKASEYFKITVKDSGIGIPEDKIANIFHRYYQVKDTYIPKFEGIGVGLALVNELINLYQGKITVSSKEGEGTEFTVYIPLDEQFLEENQLVGEFRSISINKNDDSEIFTEIQKKGMATDSAKNSISVYSDVPIILIVDDDKEVRNYIKNSLESKYRVLCSENGLQAFKKTVKIIPDLIISDMKMPELNGIELCNRLKEDERTSHIPFIMLTAYASSENRIEGLRKGADAYITKPFNTDVLEVQIVNLLESRKKLREKFSREIILGPQKITITDPDEKFLQKVVKIIEDHISDDKFNAETLGKLVGMSRMQLYRKLRSLSNQTVHEFIRNIRLKRAVQLLEERRMTITEVAYEVGFNDLTYFARCFRKQYQKSPSEFLSKK